MTESKSTKGIAFAIEPIAKLDSGNAQAAAQASGNDASTALWLDSADGLLPRLRALLDARSVHPARCVVLLPYAQLLPLAAAMWAQAFPNSFAPTFQTSMNWSQGLGSAAPGDADICFDTALDTLTAQALLARAGLEAHRHALAAPLVQAAYELAPLASASAPGARLRWAQDLEPSLLLGQEGGPADWEAAIARIALLWAGTSAYASDVLFDAELRAQVDCLVVVPGLLADALGAGLQAHWQGACALLPLVHTLRPRQSVPTLTPCADAQDEAERCAARVLQHINGGRAPVALASSDRALTRRVQALLDDAGVAIRDENGWKLSTSRSAARLLALLRACPWDASTDDVLNWIKDAPRFATDSAALEAALRRNQVAQWKNAASAPALLRQAGLPAVIAAVDALRQRLQGRHTLAQWLGLLDAALHNCGLRAPLEADAVGSQVLAALHLATLQPLGEDTLSAHALWADQFLSLADFTQWADTALEAQSFKPSYPPLAQLVVVPMGQMLARPFAAVVLAGCDEQRLDPAAGPTSLWSAAQRAVLGLPSREALEAAVRAAWEHAVRAPQCDIFWRCSDDSGQPLLASVLVQLLQYDAAATETPVDDRVARTLHAEPVAPPLPSAAALLPAALTQAAYEDLRKCPYRFFALRLLGLRAQDELEPGADKRDFGIWLHAVLHAFHLAEQGTQEGEESDAARRARWTAMLDDAAAAQTRAQGLADDEFLPYAAAWPSLRAHYLDWYAQHSASGARFESGERECSRVLGSVTLRGRIDRIDRLSDAQRLVLDYKTESQSTSAQRVRKPLEDTQMAFYAALLPEPALRAAYLSLSERAPVKFLEQKELTLARDALLAGVQADMQGIASGLALPALGQPPACDYCEVRGLCRKDFWTAA